MVRFHSESTLAASGRLIGCMSAMVDEPTINAARAGRDRRSPIVQSHRQPVCEHVAMAGFA